jgi:hypothetical protein
MNREPLGEDESLNLYAYCRNDPVNHVDRLGLEAEPIDGRIVDGLPMIVYQDWTHWWGLIIGGATVETLREPTEEQLSRFFVRENGELRAASSAERRSVLLPRSLAEIEPEMEAIRPYIENGTKVCLGVTALPAAAAAGTGEGIAALTARGIGFFLARPAAQLAVADLTYTAGELACGIDGPGGLVTPADSLKLLPKVAGCVDELFAEARVMESAWPGMMARLQHSGSPLNMAGDGVSIAKKTPLGMENVGQLDDAFAKFIRAAGVDDAVVGLRGSSATGMSRNRGPVSVPNDFDFFVVSDELYQQGLAAGARASNGALRVSATMVHFPKLHDVEVALSQALGRKTTLRIFSKDGFDAVRAGTEILSR